MGRLRSDWRVRLGAALWVLLLGVAFIGPLFVEHVLHQDPHGTDYAALGKPPSTAHWLGTTAHGQDVLAQTIYGARGSVITGLLVGVFVVILSAAIGVTGAYLGGRVDTAVNGFTNVAMTLAGFPLLLVIASYIPNVGPMGIALVIALVSWPGGARSVRAQTLSLRQREFVLAMRMLGESRTRLIVFEVLPHLLPLLSSMLLFGVVAGVFAEAGLAFLGITAGNHLSWGTMISDVQSGGGITQGMWWWFMPPGLCIVLVGMAAGLINFVIDEIANPRLRGVDATVLRRARKTEKRIAAEQKVTT